MIRCLYYREQRCLSGGWCKASWIAEVFRMDLRSIKAARKHLVALGWLQVLETPQALCNRWGGYALISLSWTRPAFKSGAAVRVAEVPSQSSRPGDFCTTELPPPLKEDTEPFQEFQHQEPAPHADTTLPSQLSPHGVLVPSPPGSGVQQHATPQTHPATLSPPTLRHIVLEDLQDTHRLLLLFQQAHTQGLIGKSDSDRLTFVAAAEHARVIGSPNPCGLFATLIRRQSWHYVTDSDEDAASQRLKQHLYGQDPPRRPAPPPVLTTPPVLSKDAFIVHEVHRAFERQGFRGDAFAWVHQEDAAWTRERWDNAIGELVQAQRAWQHANALNRLGDCMGVGEVFGPLGGSVIEGDPMA
jgi:hypothetical protein